MRCKAPINQSINQSVYSVNKISSWDPHIVTNRVEICVRYNIRVKSRVRIRFRDRFRVEDSDRFRVVYSGTGND